MNELPNPTFDDIARALGEKDITNLRLQARIRELEAENEQLHTAIGDVVESDAPMKEVPR